MKPQQISAVAFDFDGVLCDTGRMHTAALAKALKCIVDQELLEERLEALGTVPSREKIRLLGICDEDAIERIYTDKQRIFFEQELPPLAVNVPAIFAYCGRAGFRVAIVSNTNYRLVSSWLQRVVFQFEVPPVFPIITNDWCLPPKPAPDMYLLAAEMLCLSPEQLLVVEDSPNGCAAALRAGCQLMHIENPYQLSLERLKQCLSK